MDKDAVDAIAQGRVWTGMDALENGLVDELGSIDDAVRPQSSSNPAFVPVLPSCADS